MKRSLLLSILPLLLWPAHASAQFPSISGTITTYAGPRGDLATSVGFDSPLGVISDGAGGFYFTVGTRIYQVLSDGRYFAAAGTGTAGYTGNGGPANAAQLVSAAGITRDSAGNIFITDNNHIRKISAGIITELATIPDAIGSASAIAAGIDGNLFVTAGNHVVKVTPAGTITSIAGSGQLGGFSGDGGPAVLAQFSLNVRGIAVDGSGGTDPQSLGHCL